MPAKPPKLGHDKNTGRYWVRWGPHNTRWLGRDETEAKRQYADEIRAWAEWRAARATQRAEKSSGVPTQQTVQALYDRFIDARRAEGCSPYTVAFYRHSLKVFIDGLGTIPAEHFNVRLLQEFKRSLIDLGLSAKTINHRLAAIRTLFRWASDLEFCEPVNLRGCRNIAETRRPRPKAWMPARVRAIMGALPDRARPWAVVQYACLMRPSEVVRIVHGEGHWVERGIFVPHESKSEWRSKQPRHVVVSEYALSWLERCEAFCSRIDSYRQVFDRAGIAGGPHPLRHSGALGLLRLGVARADVDLALGHLPPVVSTIYAPIQWQPLRKLTERLKRNLKGVA